MTDIYSPCKCGSGKKYKWCCLKQDRELSKQQGADEGQRFEKEFEEHLQAGEVDKVAAIVDELSAAGDLATADAITLLLDRLIYHNMGGQALAIMKKLWPTMTADDGLLSWAKENFEDVLVTTLILHHCDQQPRGDTAHLMHEIEPFGFDIDDALIPGILECLDHWQEHEVSLTDFALDKINADEDDIPEAVAEALFKLGYDFVGFASHFERESYLRSNFAAVEIISYLLDRAYGVLEDENKKPSTSPSGGRFFCPDAATLANYFEAKVFSLAQPSYHAAAMILDLLPTWLKFLTARKLISEKRAQTTLQGLKPLATDLYQSCAAVVAGAGIAAGRVRWEL